MALGPIMTDLEGLAVTKQEQKLLSQPALGGIILFTRNFESPRQLTQLIDQIRQIRPELLIAVDQEGGRVQRFKNGFTELPEPGSFGVTYNTDTAKGLADARLAGFTMAKELRAFAIDFSFAPLLDLNTGISEIIGARAFHKDPQTVTEIAKAFCEGMSQAGMAAVGKHFPGHGSVAPDTHLEQVMDSRNKQTIFACDLIPFANMIQYANLAAIMPAHIVYSAVDSNPACFSKIWLQDILRQQLGFDGAVFSDDLSMVGANHISDVAVRAQTAFDAGCDMVLVCNNPQAAQAVLESVAWSNDQIRQTRLAKMKIRVSQ